MNNWVPNLTASRQMRKDYPEYLTFSVSEIEFCYEPQWRLQIYMRGPRGSSLSKKEKLNHLIFCHVKTRGKPELYNPVFLEIIASCNRLLGVNNPSPKYLTWTYFTTINFCKQKWRKWSVQGKHSQSKWHGASTPKNRKKKWKTPCWVL